MYDQYENDDCSGYDNGFEDGYESGYSDAKVACAPNLCQCGGVLTHELFMEDNTLICANCRSVFKLTEVK